MGSGTSGKPDYHKAAKAKRAAEAAKNAVPALDKALVERANAAGIFVDYGDATSREYQRNVEEIKGMDLTDDEKTAAIKELHALTEDQLKAEAQARSPYSMGVGPARFNAERMRQRGDRAVRAGAETENYMNNLRREQRQKAQRAENQRLTNAVQKAIEAGDLEFTYKGETWVRANRRSKTFRPKR